MSGRYVIVNYPAAKVARNLNTPASEITVSWPFDKYTLHEFKYKLGKLSPAGSGSLYHASLFVDGVEITSQDQYYSLRDRKDILAFTCKIIY